MSDHQKYSKKDKRELSDFMAEHLLYDYLVGVLDEQRRRSFEEHLKTSKDVQKNLKKIKKGFEYIKELKTMDVSQPLFESLKKSSDQFSISTYYNNWPNTLKLIGEFSVAGLVIWGFIQFIPWTKMYSAFYGTKGVVLTEVSYNQDDQGPLEVPLDEKKEGLLKNLQAKLLSTPAPETSTVAQNPSPTPEIISKASPTPLLIAKTSATPIIMGHLQNSQKSLTPTLAVAQVESKPSPSPTKSTVAQGIPTSSSLVVKSSPTPIAVVASKPTPSAQTKPTPVSSSAPIVAAAETEKPKALAGKGYVYRLFMRHNQLDLVRMDIVNLIKSLGGEKAGDVELGWRKPGGSYFHFTLSDKQAETLIEGLKGFAPVRVSKDEHPRVMPEGVLRYILWIEDTSQSKGQ